MSKIDDIFDQTRIDYEGVYEPRAKELIKEAVLEGIRLNTYATDDMTDVIDLEEFTKWVEEEL